LWMVLLRRLPGKFSVLAVVFASMIAAERLEPFRFEALPRDFGWIPFASFMQGSISVNIQAFCQKFYEYGGLIWLVFAVARQTTRFWSVYQRFAGGGFRACVYAGSAAWAGSVMLRICLGIDMPSFFSVPANSGVVLVR